VKKPRREIYLDWLKGGELGGVLDLRGGANDLEIDRGRREKKPRSERYCKICKDGIEDEVHVVTCCKEYQVERERVFAEMKVGDSLTGIEQLIALIGSNKKSRRQWKVIGRFVGVILSRRKEILDPDQTRERGQVVSDN